MNAQKVLEKAVQCDKLGRIMEAQNLYQDGTQMLLDLLRDEHDASKRAPFHERMSQYIKRAEQIKKCVHKQMLRSELLRTIHLVEGSEGNSYRSLFGKYIDQRVKEVVLEEPFLNEGYQFQNLIVFLELIKKKCRYLRYVRLITKRHSTEPKGQETRLNQIKTDLKNRKISMNIVYNDALLDRKIVLSNGYIIKTARGLHFYQPTKTVLSLGLVDFDFRKCLETDVQIWFIRDFGA